MPRDTIARGIAGVVIGAAMIVAAPRARAADTERWQALFAAAPAPPPSPAEARVRISARRVQDGRVLVEANDPVLRRRQQDAQALLAPVAGASAEQFKATMDAINKDPQMARLAKGLDSALDDAQRSMARGQRAPIRSSDPEVGRLLRELDRPPEPSSLSPIAAYRLELQRAQPRPGSYRQRPHELRRRHALQHAEIDRLPAADGAARQERIQRHRALAQQQLADATALHASAREGLKPAFDQMARLASQAEQRGASAGERVQAYAWFKAVIEQLDAITRATIEDVGFWEAVQATVDGADHAAPGYRLSLLPEVDLRADGTLPLLGVPYPAGRAPTPAFGPP